MKTCPACKKHLPLSTFRVRTKGNRPEAYCKLCSSKKMKEHYAANKSRYLASAKKTNAEIRSRNQLFLFEYLLAHPCVRCGESNVLVLDLDHLHDKKKNLSALVRDCASLETIQQEINKCQVLCKGCHAVKTHEQFNTYRWQLYNEHLKRESNS